MAERKAHVERNTSETKIIVDLNLDGSGDYDFDTGIGFFDLMLNSFAKQCFFDLTCKVDGDLEVDCHHTIEDTGIVLGQAIREAVGDKKGICRFGNFLLPMDETLVLGAVDLSGRPYCVCDLPFTVERVGGFDTEMVQEFFYAISYSAAMNLHLKLMHGSNKVMVDGFEINKRRCLAEQDLYLAHIKNEHGMSYIDERQMVKIKNILTEKFVEHQYHIMDTDFNNAILFLNIMICRMGDGFYVQSNELYITDNL